MKHATVAPAHIIPVHEPDDLVKLHNITADMRSRGWIGRAILCFELRDGTYQALTGSHRIAASRDASLAAIPVAAITKRETRATARTHALTETALIASVLDTRDNGDRLFALLSFNLREAAILLDEERRCNMAERDLSVGPN